MPLLKTGLSAFEAARRVADITPSILPTSTQKIEESKVRHFCFEGYVNAWLQSCQGDCFHAPVSMC